MPKVLFGLYLDIEQYEHISREAARLQRSRASIVREMIDHCRNEGRVANECPPTGTPSERGDSE